MNIFNKPKGKNLILHFISGSSRIIEYPEGHEHKAYKFMQDLYDKRCSGVSSWMLEGTTDIHTLFNLDTITFAEIKDQE